MSSAPGRPKRAPRPPRIARSAYLCTPLTNLRSIFRGLGRGVNVAGKTAQRWNLLMATEGVYVGTRSTGASLLFALIGLHSRAHVSTGRWCRGRD